MNKAISACMSKYATFTGRASRGEYWFFYLFYIIVYFVGAVAGALVGSSFLMYLFILPFVLPLFAAGIRRMHDVGKSGWFILIPFYNLVLMCTAGTKSANAYGDPVA